MLSFSHTYLKKSLYTQWSQNRSCVESQEIGNTHKYKDTHPDQDKHLYRLYKCKMLAISSDRTRVR